jgi:hypothetical protein
VRHPDVLRQSRDLESVLQRDVGEHRANPREGGWPAAYLKTDLARGAHTITVDFDMRSAGGTAEAGIRTMLIQVFAP